MVAKVSSLDVAPEMGKVYLQVEELQGPRFTARQVVEKETTMPVNPQVAAAETESSGPTQLTMLMGMVKGLQATATELQRGQAGSPSAERPYPPLSAYLLGMWNTRTRAETLSERQSAFKRLQSQL